MRLLLLFLVLCVFVFTSVAPGQTWPVPSAECPTIQAGIDSASAGDTVLVAAGTYTREGNKNLDFGGTDLVLLSEAGPELTIIDCERSGRGFYFHNGETAAAVVDGVTITNGYQMGSGGGMSCGNSSLTVSGCTFSANSAPEGAGVDCLESSHPLVESTIIEHSAAGEAVYCASGSGVTLTCCDVYGNAGGDYVGCIADQLGINGNFSACPSFCNVAGGLPSLRRVAVCTWQSPGPHRLRPHRRMAGWLFVWPEPDGRND